MKVIVFYIKQIMGLGTAGFFAWLCIGWWKIGWFWASDIHYAWLIALATVTFFLILICTPIQFVLARAKNSASYLAGLLSGPLAVMLHVATNTHFQLNFQNCIIRPMWMHLIFALIGLWFSINYKCWLGRNNSFNPKL
jgi:hypothetical protein